GPDRKPLVFAIAGAAMLVAAVLIFVLSSNSKKSQLASKTDDLKRRLDTASKALKDELKNAVPASGDRMAAELKRAKDLNDEDENVNSRFRVAAEGGGQNSLLQQLQEIEKNRTERHDTVAKVATEIDPIKMIAKAVKCVIVIRTNVGAGSGFVLTNDGL